MDEEYDVIVLGTGLKECILSGLLSVHGKKVLHMDRNDYYGGDSASITPLTKLFELFGRDTTPTEEQYGRLRDYHVDLVPKFIMACGKLVQMLVHTGVSQYLEFKLAEGSYVYNGASKQVFKVPVTETEALVTNLMGMLEKKRFRDFLQWAQEFKADDKATWKDMDPATVTMQEVFSRFGLEKNTIDFTGHAIALCRDDDYLSQPYPSTVLRMQLYNRSLGRYGKAPYLYPLYGLGEMPQGFARLSAVWGGVYMLDTPVDDVVVGPSGSVSGVKSGDNLIKTKAVIGDPSYFPDRVRKVGQVVRCVCILDHPVPNTNEAASCQIIMPASQIQPPRKSDIYIMSVSATHKVAAQGRYIATVSTTVETDDPEGELFPGLDLLGPIQEKFCSVKDMMVPMDDGSQNSVFVTSSYDATSHFESTCDDVLAVWQHIMGEELDLSKEIVKPLASD